MNRFVGEQHERYAAEMCLRVAYRRLKDGDVDLSIKRTEEALRSLRELQALKKPTDVGASIGG